MRMKRDVRCLVGLVTCPDVVSAKKIAKCIVKEKLCACVNILKNMESVFFWENKVQKEKEVLLLIKTTDKNKVKLTKIIRKMHPYKVPEIIFLEIQYGLDDFLAWIKKESS